MQYSVSSYNKCHTIYFKLIHCRHRCKVIWPSYAIIFCYGRKKTYCKWKEAKNTYDDLTDRPTNWLTNKSYVKSKYRFRPRTRAHIGDARKFDLYTLNLCIYTLAVGNLDPILFDYLWLGSLLRELDCDSGIDTRRSVNRQCRHPCVLRGRDETMV